MILASKIPKNVWTVMTSKKPIIFNRKLGKKYKLNSEQVDLITLIESQIFYKELPLQTLPSVLQRELNLNSGTAQELGLDIYNKLFRPLRSYFKEMPQKPPKPPASIKPTPSPAIIPPTPSVVPSNLPATNLATPIPPVPIQQKEKAQTKSSDVYKIRTMKQDIERARQESIPQKSAKTDGNVVDLSKK